jgi:molybdate transport system permease protein
MLMDSSIEWQAVLTSLGVAARALVFTLPLAILLGWVLARKRFAGHALLDALIHAPLVLPPVVVGYVLLLTFGVQSPIGHWLDQTFGIRLVFTAEGAALAAGIVALPIMVRSVRLSLETIDPRLEIAAASLGADGWERFRTITLPLTLPGILSAAILGIAISLGEFGAVITFAANVPGETQTLALAIYGALQLPDGEALALRLALISMLIAISALLAAEWLGRYARRWHGKP